MSEGNRIRYVNNIYRQNAPSYLTHLVWSFQVVVLSAYCMPGILGLARRVFSTMAAEYKAGTHSVVFVTVPNADTGKKLAK